MNLRTIVLAIAVAVLARKIARDAARRKLQADPIPPWPAPGEDDPLDEIFGPAADRVRVLTPEELDALRREGAAEGSAPDPDLTKPGHFGRAIPPTPSTDWTYRITRRMRDGTWRRVGSDELPPCGQIWILDFEHDEPVPTCNGVSYTVPYRRTLLRAFVEAFRYCRERDPQCPDARLWILHAHWNCYDHAKGPTVFVGFKFAVMCVAR